jgi:hypothetical protein
MPITMVVATMPTVVGSGTSGRPARGLKHLKPVQLWYLRTWDRSVIMGSSPAHTVSESGLAWLLTQSCIGDI